jgi:hypothetical protein
LRFNDLTITQGDGATLIRVVACLD